MRKIADSNHFQFINNNHSYYYKNKEHVDEKNEFDVLLELNDTHKKAVKYKGEFWNYVTLVDDKHTQGWKIHISSTIENYLRIFYLVSKYCISQNINFKYIKNMKIYRLSHDKSYSRESAGKFIVIYPCEKSFQTVIESLYKILHNFKGQYILSDKRYKDSQCIYYRYGEFYPIYVLNELGVKESFILDDNNNYYKDERLPYYKKPHWVDNIIDELYLEEKESLLLKEYNITSVINFSSTGGTYIGSKNNKEFIIKEARAFTGLDRTNNYSKDRLLHEKKY